EKRTQLVCINNGFHKSATAAMAVWRPWSCVCAIDFRSEARAAGQASCSRNLKKSHLAPLKDAKRDVETGISLPALPLCNLPPGGRTGLRWTSSVWSLLLDALEGAGHPPMRNSCFLEDFADGLEALFGIEVFGIVLGVQHGVFEAACSSRVHQELENGF